MGCYSLQPKESLRAQHLSDAIKVIKFPLAVLVVILHCDLSTKLYERMGIATADITAPLYSNLSWILSRYLAYAAVPCFFVISGFLLFYNVTVYDKNVYLEKLKKRCKSLLVPYLIWCLIYLLIYWIIGQQNIILSEVPDLFNNSLSLSGLIVNIFIKPLDGPLWFIRNLFVMVVLSPFLYAIIKRTKYLLPLSLLVLTQIVHNPFIESFLWFSFGISFAIHKLDFMYLCHKWLWFSLTIVAGSVLLDFILFDQLNMHIAGHFSVFKIMSVFGIVYYLVSKCPTLINNSILNESSFTIYAYHGLAVLILLPILHNLSILMGGGLILTYFLTIIIVVAIGIALSVLINKNEQIRILLCGR
jgi:fucose 4-O-acetylase-like acetyltransferase